MKKIFQCVAMIILLCVSFNVEAVDEIRIGLIEPIETDSDIKNLSRRYITTYMVETAKYLNCKYIYESGTLNECYEKLLRGELDFIVPVINSTDERFILSEVAPIPAILNLYCRRDNEKFSVQNARIGFVENELTEKFLKYYVAENYWQVELQSFESARDMMTALAENRIDMITDDGTHITENEKFLSAVGQIYGRFITTQDKKFLMDKLNSAMLTIELRYPFFTTWLQYDYILSTLQRVAEYSELEKNFIKETPPLKIVFMSEQMPLYNVKNLSKPRGLCIDLMRMIAYDSGLKFEYIKADSMDEVGEKLWSGDADMAFVVFASGVHSNTVKFSNTIYVADFVPIIPRDIEKIPSNATVALPICFPGMQSYWKEHFPDTTIKFYGTIEECLEAVDNAEVDISYLPTMFLRRDNNLIMYPNLMQDDSNIIHLPICLAISTHQSEILQRVMNTAILHLPDEQIKSLALKYSEPRITLRYLIAQYPLPIAIILILLGIAAIILVRRQLKKRHEKILAERDNMMKTLISDRDNYKTASEFDNLTQVYNKATMERYCKEYLEEFADNNFTALYVIDLDKFKQANDTYGHQYGDKILQNFAKNLKNIFRANDFIGRFGGDEFVVMIINIPSMEIVMRKGSEIHRAARNILIDDKVADITASIGIAVAPTQAADYENLFKSADKSLYHVKNNGRDGYCYEPPQILR